MKKKLLIGIAAISGVALLIYFNNRKNRSFAQSYSSPNISGVPIIIKMSKTNKKNK